MIDKKKLRDEWAEHLSAHRYDHNTERFAQGLAYWITDGVPPGSFFFAVLCNDLFDAMGRADIHSQAGLHAIVSMVYNYAPNDCWGSNEICKSWHDRGGLVGIMGQVGVEQI